MDFENKVAKEKMNEIKSSLKNIDNERLIKMKVREYEDFLNEKTSLTNIEKTNYLQKLENEITNK